MANVAVKLEINNKMSEQESLMFQADNIADVITMMRSKSGNTIILNTEDNFKVEYDEGESIWFIKFMLIQCCALLLLNYLIA